MESAENDSVCNTPSTPAHQPATVFVVGQREDPPPPPPIPHTYTSFGVLKHPPHQKKSMSNQLSSQGHFCAYCRLST